MIGYVYLTKNDVNDIIYVGKRQKSKFEKSYKGSGTHLKLAFKKYGKDKFHTTVLEECYTEKELCEAEIKWIAHFREAGKEMYNIADGGKGGNMIRWSELPPERRAAINKKNSESHLGNKNPFYGKKHTEATKVILREKNRAQNKKLPEELRAYKESQRKKLPKIAQFDISTGELIAIWNNWCEASKAVSKNNRCGYAHIGQCCRHERKTAYGFRWEFAETGWQL